MAVKYGFLLVAASFLLTGCISQTTVTGPVNGAGGAVRPVLVIARPVNSTRMIHKTVSSGDTITVVSAIAVNPDCTSQSPGRLHIIQAPVNGQARIARRSDYPTFPQGNPHAACNSKKLPGAFVEYTSNDDFTGEDFMVVNAITNDGADITLKISVTVK